MGFLKSLCFGLDLVYYIININYFIIKSKENILITVFSVMKVYGDKFSYYYYHGNNWNHGYQGYYSYQSYQSYYAYHIYQSYHGCQVNIPYRSY